jgi:hypothetical protein
MDFLDETRNEIAGRLKELKPLVNEYSRLQAAASALAGVGGTATGATATPRRRGPGRPRGSVSHASKATPVSAPTSTPAATPAKAARKKPGRPPGRKKAARPA